MKKLLTLGFILLMLLSLSGQAVFYGPTHPVEWDAHAPMADSIISYELYLFDGTTQVLVDETAALTYTFDLPGEGVYVFGVRTVRNITSTGEKRYSAINWSDVNGLETPNPFEASNYDDPVAVEGFRHQ